MRFHTRLPVIGLVALASVASADIKITPYEEIQRGSSVATDGETTIFVVQMAESPVTAYEGDIKGYQATKPGNGKKINPNSAHVRKYAKFLGEQQEDAMESVDAEKVYSYRYAFNGFAARMTADEARALQKRGDVVKVWRDEIRQLQTNNSPNYINITEGGEAWSNGLTGEDVVIGVIDTGVWPEHPSFADVATPKKGNKGPAIEYGSIPGGFTPSGCDFGDTGFNPYDSAFDCNNKLVTARCYNAAFSSGPGGVCGGDGAGLAGWEFLSARDPDGHGSHTASTAGGNFGVPAYVGDEFQGDISGIAPRARIAVYKSCWDGLAGSGCGSADSAAAIDQAVADGVDVINFSVGGSSNAFNGPDDLAFLFAADAGVLVATSNGNAGPGEGTVGTPAGVPWITAVGATQDDGVFDPDLTVNGPVSIAGKYDSRMATSDVTLADTGAITADVTLASTVFACVADGAVDPITGIALVSRGGCSFTEKFNNVAAAGASAIIVYNNTPGAPPPGMIASGTTIPGVAVTYEDGVLMENEAGVNVTLDYVSGANRVAGFSSRGPNNGAPDIIKPDLSAPGVSTLAAYTPWNGGEYFASISGTSMASPHVAGAFALLKQKHPDWTPAIAKSALMTTARADLLKTKGPDAADPFDIGAGEILPSDSDDPGLAYDAGFLEYLAMLCGEPAQAGLVTSGDCDFLEAIGLSLDPSDLNLASIGVAELMGSQTVTRTVTAVYNNNGSKNFTVSVDAPAGIDVTVTPSKLKLRKGESATYEVTLTATDGAEISEWAFGSLTWSDKDGVYSVRSPIAVRPIAILAQDEVEGVADAQGGGSIDTSVQFGYSGDYEASVSGITPSGAAAGNVTSTDYWCIDLPVSATHFRLATFDDETSDPGNDDIDFEVFLLNADCANATFWVESLGASAGATSEEVVDIPNAGPGGYYIEVNLFSASNGSDTDYLLWFQTVFGDEGNATVSAPASAVLGTTETVTVDYTGLAPTRHLGILHHEADGEEVARTILDIDARQ